jgi:nitrite reductase (cytochrome c-552)
MNENEPTKPEKKKRWNPAVVYGLTAIATAILIFVVAALLVSIFERKREAREPFVRLVEVDENTTDPAVWGVNWPQQYDSYRRTVDYHQTRYGGSDAIPAQKLDQHPWLRSMFSGYAFALDYREARGHAYMLWDQDHTERVQQRPQPGACLHCHSSVLPAYRFAGNGDIMEGFRRVNAMSWNEARHLRDDHGELLIQHPASCVDCHDPRTMNLRITRPAFMQGIADLKAAQGTPNYDVNRDATRHEMRSFICAQCHVEYYFQPPNHQLTYPWANGIKVEEIEAYFDERDYTDWTHGITGAPMLKAQHPEFELWSQGTHARAGVSCSDCPMPSRHVGAMKVSDHHVRSPLLDVAASCQTCHRVPENELIERAHTIQDRTVALIQRTAQALMDLMENIVEARAAGATREQLHSALAFHRKAQWRLDFIFSENSHGFHAPQESARILAESIDYSRQGVMAAQRAKAAPEGPPAETPPPEPVRGVTPAEEVPPGVYDRFERIAPQRDRRE